MSRRLALAAVAALTAGTVAGPAAAVDETKPDVSCFGYLFKDKADDVVSAGPGGDTDAKPANLDLIDGFLKYEPSQGAEGATVNIRVKNLTKDIPPGATAIIWQASYTGAAGDGWVRAVTDFSGLVSYDYGAVENTPGIPFNVRHGGTTGAFFEGENGIVQIAFPEARDPKGTALKSFAISTSEAVQVLPAAAPTPVKGGVVYEDDNASGGKTVWTIGEPCPAQAPATPAPQPSPSSPVRVQESPLPVKVLTRSLKRSKNVKGRLRASETITQLAAQLKKGRKVLGKGSMAKLSGTKTLKLKARKGLRTGSYVLDLAGTDSTGARRFASAKLKVR